MDNLKESDIEFINEARIMSFLRGAMDAEEEAKFKEDVAHDPKLKADAINLARIAKGMKQVGEEKDSLLINAFLASGKGLLTKEGERKSTDTESHRTPRSVAYRKLSVWLSIAASLVIFVWIGIGYHSYKNTTSLGEEYCNAISSGIVARGSVGVPETERKLSVLFNNVQNGKNLDAAIHELSAYWDLSNEEVFNDYTNYFAEIGWYLSIAYLKDNDKEKAKIVLEKLIASTEKDTVVNKKAKELLKRL